jgi:beta-glucosidase
MFRTMAAAGALAFCITGTACSGTAAAGKVPANAAYKNAELPVGERIEDLLKRMTLQEKIGQMTQIDKGSLKGTDVSDFLLGSVLSGGGGSPSSNTVSDWADMVDFYQEQALATRLAIPMIYGVDSVHGHGNLYNATIFPHNIGLGAANDADLVKRIGTAVALETAATGILWNFGPCLAIAQDPRWGRTYESFGQSADLVTKLGAAYIKGYQTADAGNNTIPVATAKHFLGDGGTLWGTSTTNDYKIDQGDTRGDEAYLRNVLLAPYVDAVKNGVRTVMVSFSSWNGVKMHAQKELITGILKTELGFTGFVVSDWGGIDQVSSDYYQSMVTGINAGIDMNMVPYDAGTFILTVEKAVTAKDIPMERIDDAVRRILRVKFEMGLFETPMANRNLASSVRSAGHLALAREAVAKSQVVLKNGGVLPLKKTVSKLYVSGIGADDMGIQCGGWTKEWQGETGNITAGTTILAGIREKIPGADIVYDAYGNFEETDRNSVCVVVLGENPYAEGVGDNGSLSINPRNLGVLEKAIEKFNTIVLLLVSGRTLILGDAPASVDALVAVWLPGTEGAGVADVLFGDVKPTGRLSFAWPSSVEQLPLGNFVSGAEKPLYPLGFGLDY